MDDEDIELLARLDAQAMEERAANARAKARGEPMPFPNPWDALDPTKVPEGATEEELQASYQEFMKRCRTPLKRHTI